MTKKNTQPQYDESTDLGHLPIEHTPPTNDTALLSFLAGIGGWLIGLGGFFFLSTLGFCCVPVAMASWAASLVAGRMSKNQIAKTGEEGSDLATWGMAASFAGFAVTILGIIAILLLLLLGVISLGALNTLQ